MADRPEPVWVRPFLAAYATRPFISQAAKAAGVPRRTVNERRKTHPEFKEQCREVHELYIDGLEAEVHRRAFEGVDKPVFQGGKEVGSVREYSDRLAELVLKARRSDLYRERQDVNHEGLGSLTITVVRPGEDGGGAGTS